MRLNKKVLGIIFANTNESLIPELTHERTMGSVMFGGRYRLIDFTLSNMANSGVDEVGVITKSNYQSLLDHLGSGREWDLSRKNGGLHLLPPFSHTSSGMFRGRLEALYGVWDFIKHSDADYVIMSDCGVVTSIDYNKPLAAHIESGADITVVYSNENLDIETANHSIVLGIDTEDKVNSVYINPSISGECAISLNMYIMSTRFLKNLVEESNAKGLYDFEKSILQAKCSEYNIKGYLHDAYFSRITSKKAYYDANMELLNRENKKNLFPEDAPVYTKIKDNPPAKFAIGASVKNSIIADGCIIEGTVEDSIVFRGAKIGKGAFVKDSIVMQDTIIGKNCGLSCIITDKQVEISDGKLLYGSPSYPIYIGKGAKI